MSINSALLSGVSGLLANSTALASISDNIANVNTTGYKRNETSFQTIVTARGTGNTGRYSAGGVLANTRQRISEQGLLQRTASTTDLGIDGTGFFITTQKPEDVAITDSRLFTRAGSFTLDELGYLKNSAGLYLQGWEVGEDGTVNADPSDLTLLRSINVAQVGGAAQQTTRIGINANLNASTPLSTAITTAVVADQYGAGTANNMAAYDRVAGTGVKPDFELQIPISDSKGGRRTIAISFLRDSAPNEWYAEMHISPASEIEFGAGLRDGQVKVGKVAFTQDGRLDTARSTLFDGDSALAGVQFSPTLNVLPSDYDTALTPLAAGEVKWADSLGIAGQSIFFDLEDAAAGLTQFNDAASEVQSTTTNGTALGNLTNVEIDDKGFVTAVFDNGVIRKIAQVALATFPNTDGLRPLNGNAYRVSLESGNFNLKTPGAGGAGVISPSTLEASTVDLSSEFTGLITTQRAYSASSKIITTADEMLEELIRIKR
jgi:flagellar hook protein FlgE